MPRSTPAPLGRIVTAGTAAALVLGEIVGQTFAWLTAPHGSWWSAWSRLTSSQLYDVARSDVAAVGLVGAGGAALIAYRRQKTAESRQDTANLQYLLDKTRQEHAAAIDQRAAYADLRSRYASAAEQLGHAQAAVRIAGVYAMAELADDWSLRRESSQQQVCIDVLCAYLRMAPSASSQLDQEAQVRRTIATILRSHLLDPESVTSWSGADIDLSGALLEDANFADVVMTGRQVDFSGARFTGQHVDFSNARLSADFVEFHDAKFLAVETDFSGVTFAGRATNFYRASMAGERFVLRNVSFGAEMTYFNETRFDSSRWTMFSGSRFTGAWVSFDEAVFTGGTTDFSDMEMSSRHFGFLRTEFASEATYFSRSNMDPGAINIFGAKFQGNRVSFSQCTRTTDYILDMHLTNSWLPEVVEYIGKPRTPSWINLPDGVSFVEEEPG